MTVQYPLTPTATPYFSGVKADDFQGPADAMTVTSGGTSQTLAEWIAAGGGGSSGTSGVGIRSVVATQGAVTAGQPSTVTLTSTLTDGTTSETTFVVPPGARGDSGQGSGGETASAAVTVVNVSDAYTIDGSTPYYDLTVTGAVSLTLPEGVADTGAVLTVQIRQTGAFAVTLPVGCEWLNGPPTITQVAGQRVFLKFILMGTTGPWAGQVGF